MVTITIANAGWPRIGRNHHAFDRQPRECHHAERDAARNQERPAESRVNGETRKRAEHHQLALREVDGFGRLVDEYEAERDQAVDATLGDAADQDLRQLQLLPPIGAAARRAGSSVFGAAVYGCPSALTISHSSE